MLASIKLLLLPKDWQLSLGAALLGFSAAIFQPFPYLSAAQIAIEYQLLTSTSVPSSPALAIEPNTPGIAPYSSTSPTSTFLTAEPRLTGAGLTQFGISNLSTASWKQTVENSHFQQFVEFVIDSGKNRT
jgi:hypothetical protein